MANELAVKSGVTFTKGLTSISRVRSFSLTVDGTEYSAGVLSCTTNAQLIPMDLIDARMVWFCNLSETTGEKIDIANSSITEDAYGFVSPIITLYPGDVAQFPPGDLDATWFAVAHTGTPKLEFFGVEQ